MDEAFDLGVGQVLTRQHLHTDHYVNGFDACGVCSFRASVDHPLFETTQGEIVEQEVVGTSGTFEVVGKEQSCILDADNVRRPYVG